MKLRYLTAICLLVFGFTSLAFAATTSSLDGKTFNGELVTQGSEKPDSDNFVFDKGTFRSTACDEYGYTAAPYTLSATGPTTSFKAQTKNPQGATIAWDGKVSGNEISGTAIMTAANGDKTNMTFKGSLQK